MLKPLWFYWREYRPSTLYYKYVQHIYAKGRRPSPGSPFYSDVLAKEARWMYDR